ncbi:hypothetical protein K474DRAFT_1603362 [Panus rudis PR-1116 ss-1]|nr:hypothetical protein K474DRAFT_1603362 [Panus rudis PR-1116 ss-1]
MLRSLPKVYSSANEVENTGELIQVAMDAAWQRYATPPRHSSRSKSWWNAECSNLHQQIKKRCDKIRDLRASLRQWQHLVQNDPEHHLLQAVRLEHTRLSILSIRKEVEELRREFRACVRRAKHLFFDDIISSAQDSQRVWDLVDWTKPRRVNAAVGLTRSDGSCIESPEELKEAFQNQFTPINPHPVDLTCVEEIPQILCRDFPPISIREIFEALQDTSNSSAPGPDHCASGKTSFS